MSVLKNIGKVFVLVASLCLLVIMSIIFYSKGIQLVPLIVFYITTLAVLTGLLWPKTFRWLASGRKGRKMVLKLFGIPAAALFILFYAAVIFYIQDLPVILGILSLVALVFTIITFLRPKTLERRLAHKHKYRRTAVFAILAVILLLFTFASIPLVENYQNFMNDKAAEKRLRAIQSTSPNTPVKDGKVKVYPLHIGDTVVTYGQFYGGLDGWEGLRGYFYTLINKDTITVPIYSYLIDHPKNGLILVDTCINWEQAHQHDGFYNHNYMLSRLFNERNEYKLLPEQELQVQVERLGYKPDEIKTVFLTHVHDDHAGGLRNLPDAKVVLNKNDWERGTLYPYSFELVKDNLELFTFDSLPLNGFSKSLDYFGDGSVVLLPTPGHSPGHTAVLLKTENHYVLFAGDTPYTLRHMSVNQVRQMTIGGSETEKQITAIRQLQQLIEAYPDTVLLFAHDHTDYQSALIEQSLVDGYFSKEELKKIQDYRFSIFDDKWELRPGNTPYYIPSTSKEETGRAGFK